MMLGIGGASRSSSLRLDWLHQSAVDRRRLNAICPELKAILAGSLLQEMVSVAELEAGMIGTRTRAALAAAKERSLAGHVVCTENLSSGVVVVKSAKDSV